MVLKEGNKMDLRSIYYVRIVKVYFQKVKKDFLKRFLFLT